MAYAIVICLMLCLSHLEAAIASLGRPIRWSLQFSPFDVFTERSSDSTVSRRGWHLFEGLGFRRRGLLDRVVSGIVRSTSPMKEIESLSETQMLQFRLWLNELSAVVHQLKCTVVGLNHLLKLQKRFRNEVVDLIAGVPDILDCEVELPQTVIDETDWIPDGYIDLDTDDNQNNIADEIDNTVFAEVSLCVPVDLIEAIPFSIDTWKQLVRSRDTLKRIMMRGVHDLKSSLEGHLASDDISVKELIPLIEKLFSKHLKTLITSILEISGSPLMYQMNCEFLSEWPEEDIESSTDRFHSSLLIMRKEVPKIIKVLDHAYSILNRLESIE